MVIYVVAGTWDKDADYDDYDEKEVEDCGAHDGAIIISCNSL